MSLSDKPISFAALFSEESGATTIREIEVPLIQRDYAQGRLASDVSRIRSNLVKALWQALRPDAIERLELDFIYGDVDANGKFIPLDGQQRLTLLFLLHCYITWQTGKSPSDQPWAKFSYATRPGARTFCEFLTTSIPDLSEAPSKWIRDQPHYLPTWDYDPSIQSMLVVLDALDQHRPSDIQWEQAWQRLTDHANPAIGFHLLSMKASGLADSHYIKMNSRGKPLTAFENFKARLEQVLSWLPIDSMQDVAAAIDGPWSDTLWRTRDQRGPAKATSKSEDETRKIVDEGFMRYFRFILEVCAWKGGVSLPRTSPDDKLAYLCELAELVFGNDTPQKEQNLEFMRQAFDTWHERNTDKEFGSLFTLDRGYDPERIRLWKGFPDQVGVNFFKACCRYYGEGPWDLAHTLLFYAVIKGKVELNEGASSQDIRRRLRIARNLTEASRDGEIRAGQNDNRMPQLLAEVAALMESGAFPDDSAFNTGQVENERKKETLLIQKPELEDALFKLEDHVFLQGGLTSFDLSPQSFAATSSAFLSAVPESSSDDSLLWANFGAALLTFGDYSRQWVRHTGYIGRELGSPYKEQAWQTLFRGKDHGKMHSQLRSPLAHLLKEIQSGASTKQIVEAYLSQPTQKYEWRDYLVRYPVMRSGFSGRYMFSREGYRACMLHKSENMRSYYADPYLCALAGAAGLPQEELATPRWPQAFFGYEDQERWLSLKIGLKVRSTLDGWAVEDISEALISSNEWELAKLELNCINATLELQADGKSAHLKIPQEAFVSDETSAEQHLLVDTVDRIKVGAKWLMALRGEA